MHNEIPELPMVLIEGAREWQASAVRASLVICRKFEECVSRGVPSEPMAPNEFVG